MNHLVSIVIPCYNSGAYLIEAIESIESCLDTSSFEVIIVDDGSTDKLTKELLLNYTSNYQIYYQENKGPAAARNMGIKKANGNFILFLDSDNKLISGYIDKAVNFFLNNEEVGVIYSDVYFFGESKEPRFKPEKYDFEKLLAQNYIDMCAVIRKKIWQEIGGLDENKLIIGREDWDFWLRIGKTKWKFHFINEKLYQYRIRRNSLIASKNQKKQVADDARSYIYAKHIDALSTFYPKAYIQSVIYLKDKKKPFRSFIKFVYLLFKDKVTKK